MFNFSGSEIIFILLLALIILGPEKLPEAMRKFGQTYAELKKLSSGFQSEIKQAFDEPMREMRATADEIKRAASFPLDGADGPTAAGPVPPTAPGPVPPTAPGPVPPRKDDHESSATPTVADDVTVHTDAPHERADEAVGEPVALDAAPVDTAPGDPAPGEGLASDDEGPITS